MKNNLYINSQNRLFRIDGDKPELLNEVDVWRIMWYGGNQRVILRGFIDGYEWVQNFPKDCDLELVRFTSEWESYSDGKPFYRFYGCRINRKWVPHATASSFDETQRLDIWIEINCDVVFLGGLDKGRE